jgi:hypothetical protein
MYTLLLLTFLVGANVSARDKGDLRLNIEFQMSISLSDNDVKIDDKKAGDIYPDSERIGAGGDIFLRGTLHYYLFPFFALNSGLGFGMFSHSVTFMDDDLSRDDLLKVSSSCYYFTIPAGFRFSLSAFTTGAGITVNIPVLANTNVQQFSVNEKDGKFKANTFLGWYVELGFDLSGRKSNPNPFGMMLRYSASLSDQIANTTGEWRGQKIKYEPFEYSVLSFIFQWNLKLGTIPAKK